MERALDLVLVTGDQVLVGDGVGEGELAVPVRLGLVEPVGGGEGGADLGHVHGLVLVGEVSVDRPGAALARDVLEGDEALAGEAGGVEGELELDLAVGLLGLEGERGGDLGAVRAGRGLTGVLVHEGAGDRVLAAGREALVGDRVGHLDLARGRYLVEAGAGVGRGGADLRELDLLALVGRVLVAGVGHAVAGKDLEDGGGAAGEGAGVDLEGDRRLAVGRGRRERRGGGIGVAGGVGQGLAGLGVGEGGAERVLAAGREALVGDGVGELGVLGGAGDLRAVLALRLGRNLGDADRLALVREVLVGRHGALGAREHLEDDDALALEAGGVNLQVHGGGAVRRLGDERLGRGGRAAVLALGLALVGPVGGDDVGRRAQHVLGAGAQALVVDPVADGRERVGGHVLAAVAVGRGGVDGREGDGLVEVGRVVMLGEQRARVIVEVLVGHDRVAGEAARVDLGALAHGPVGAVGRDGLSHLEVGAVGRLEEGARGGVPELHDELVGPALGDVGDLHGVREGEAFRGLELLVAGGVGELALEAGHRVGHGAGVEVHAVAGDAHLDADELEAPVRVAAELLDGVGVIGQRAERVVGPGPCGAGGVAVEPGAGERVELRAVGDGLPVGREQGVVGIGGVLDAVVVGVGRVRVPARGRVVHAVRVGNDHVRLARGLGGDEEGHARQAVLGDAGDLVEADVAALDGLGHAGVGGAAGHGAHARRRVEAGHLAVLPDLEGAGPLGVQFIALGGAGLAHLVGAVGERAALGLGHALLVGGDGRHDLAGLVERASDLHGPGGAVGDLELGSLEGGGAGGRGRHGVGVELADLDVARRRGVRHRGGAVGALDLALALDLEVVAPVPVHAVGGVALGLDHVVGAEGQGVRGRGAVAVPVEHDGGDHPAAADLASADHDGAVVVGDDGDLDALERGVAGVHLGAGVGVALGHGRAAAHDVLLEVVLGGELDQPGIRDLGRVGGGGHGVLVGLAVQLVTPGGLGLADGDFAEGDVDEADVAVGIGFTGVDLAVRVGELVLGPLEGRAALGRAEGL